MRARISLRICAEINSSRELGTNAAKNASAASTDIVVRSWMFLPASVTASASGFSRAPLHTVQVVADMYFSMSSLT